MSRVSKFVHAAGLAGILGLTGSAAHAAWPDIVTDLIPGTGEKDAVEDTLGVLTKADISKIFRSGRVPIEIMVNAQFPEVSELDRIAVVDFSGQDGSAFSAALRDELSSAVVRQEPVFQISGTIGVDGTTSAQNVLAAAKRANLDAVYLGETNFTTSRSTPWQEEICVKKKNFGFGCEEERRTSCWNVQGGYVANIRVVKVSDGTSIYEESKHQISEAKQCALDDDPAPDPRQLALGARGAVLASIRDEIIPRTEFREVPLKTRAQDLSREDGRMFKDAIKAAKKGRFDRACGVWAELQEKEEGGERVNENSVALLYNLGVCAEYQWDFDTALAMYRTADSLVTAGDDESHAGIARVESAQAAATGR